MTWFRVDDQFHSHPKAVGASDAAVALWTLAGSWSACHRQSGHVPTEALASLRSDPEPAANELVRRGLWRRAVGGFQFHDWSDVNPTALEVLTRETTRKRRARLHRHPQVLAAVRDRDGDTCQRCKTHVRFADKRSPLGGTYAVADPDGPITLDTVAVSCRGCATKPWHYRPDTDSNRGHSRGRDPP